MGGWVLTGIDDMRDGLFGSGAFIRGIGAIARGGFRGDFDEALGGEVGDWVCLREGRAGQREERDQRAGDKGVRRHLRSVSSASERVEEE